jgi:magnesium-transporting ATPase (P-type)
MTSVTIMILTLMSILRAHAQDNPLNEDTLFTEESGGLTGFTDAALPMLDMQFTYIALPVAAMMFAAGLGISLYAMQVKKARQIYPTHVSFLNMWLGSWVGAAVMFALVGVFYAGYYFNWWGSVADMNAVRAYRDPFSTYLLISIALTVGFFAFASRRTS